jgi:hypothetical protein
MEQRIKCNVGLLYLVVVAVVLVGNNEMWEYREQYIENMRRVVMLRGARVLFRNAGIPRTEGSTNSSPRIPEHGLEEYPGWFAPQTWDWGWSA